MIAFANGWLDPSRWEVVENLACLTATASSNDLARGVIELYFEEEQTLPPSLFVAEEQTKARGRKGAWHAPRGRGLYLTLVKRVEETEPMSVIPIAVARWTRDALAEAAGLTAELKWPNDIYVRRRKLAGILAEARSQGEESYIAVGVGVNVRGEGASLDAPNATTLEEQTGRCFALAPLLQMLLDRFDRELTHPQWEEEVRRWERASVHRPGDRLKIRSDGKEIQGEYLGLDPSGFLRLRTSVGETVFPAGELAAW